MIAHYTPRSISRDDWNRVSEFVRDLVTRSFGDAEPIWSDTRFRLQATSQLTVWATGQGYDLDAEQILNPAVIEAFISQTSWSSASKGSARGVLFSMARTLIGADVKALPKPATYNGGAPKTCDDEEIAELVDWVTHVTSHGRLLEKRASLALGFGAGLQLHEMADLKVGDIHHGWIHVPGDHARKVPVRSEWWPMLKECLEGRDPGEWLLWADDPDRNDHRLDVSFMRLWRHLPTRMRPPATTRMRATWIVYHLRAGTPGSKLLAWSGLTRFTSLRRYTALVFSGDRRLEVNRRLRGEKTSW